jgi:maltose/moltooligosaccharide transporter
VLWTVFTTKEYPPTESDKAESNHNGFAEIIDALKKMPKRMKQLAFVQFFTWMGLFCMWIFYSVAAARDIFKGDSTESELYKQGTNFANDCFATYNFVAFLAAIALLYVGRIISAKHIHFVSLLCGGLGLMSVLFIQDQSFIKYVAFSGVGIAWASILSMPYAMLAGALPEKRTGVYMGIFNLFIVLPQILVAIILSRVLESYEGISRLQIVFFGGLCFAIAAAFTLLVQYSPDETPSEIA